MRVQVDTLYKFMKTTYKTKTKSKNKNSGFTLIELIVVISIAAILASIAIPNFTKMIDSNRTTAATNEFVSALVLARSEALTRGVEVKICTSEDLVSCAGNSKRNFANGWIVFTDCNSNNVVDALADCDNDGTADDVETIIKAHSAIKNMKIHKNGLAATRDKIAYTFSGRTSNSVTFNLRKKIPGVDTPIIRQIKINRTGRVRTCKPGKC